MTDEQRQPPAEPSPGAQPPAWEAPPQPPAWDAPPQPPAWDRDPGPGAAAPGAWGPAPSYGGPAAPAPGYGYGAPVGYGYPGGYAPPQSSGKAVAALVLAIVSFVVLPLVPAVVSLVLAAQAKREIASSGGRLGGDGMVTAARVVSWINIGLCIAFAALIIVVVAVALSTSGTTSA